MRVESKRLIVRAKRVIVAIPPVLAGRIDYSPDLPAEREALTQRLPQGTLCKVAAVYDRPFWRDKGLTGQALSLNGPVTATFDDSPPDGSPGRGVRLRGRRRRAQAVPQHAPARAPRAGARQVRRPSSAPRPTARVDYFETNWPQERCSRGGPVGISRAGHAARPGRGAAPRRCAGSTGRAPRPPPTGTATWTAPCAPASGPPGKCWTGCEARRPRRGARRGAARARRGGAGAARARFNTQVLALVPSPGFPAQAYVHPDGRIYEGTYVNMGGDSLPSKVFEYTGDGDRSRGVDRAGPEPLRAPRRAGDHLRLARPAGGARPHAGARAAAGPAHRRVHRLLHLRRPQAVRARADPAQLLAQPGGPPADPQLRRLGARRQPVRDRLRPGRGVARAAGRRPGRRCGCRTRAWTAASSAPPASRWPATAARCWWRRAARPGWARSTPPRARSTRCRSAPTAGPRGMTQLWESRPGDLPDGFGIARSGRLYVPLVGLPQQIAVVSPQGQEIERFPEAPGGENGSPVPFDGPSSARFLGTRLIVANQSPVAGDPAHQALLDVEAGEPGLTELIPGLDRTRAGDLARVAVARAHWACGVPPRERESRAHGSGCGCPSAPPSRCAWRCGGAGVPARGLLHAQAARGAALDRVPRPAGPGHGPAAPAARALPLRAARPGRGGQRLGRGCSAASAWCADRPTAAARGSRNAPRRR